MGNAMDMCIHCYTASVVPGNVHDQMRHLGPHSRQGALEIMQAVTLTSTSAITYQFVHGGWDISSILVQQYL